MVIDIREIKNRLKDELGITYHKQGANVIRTVWSEQARESYETELHFDIDDVNKAAAAEAYLVLQDGEQLAARWQT